LETRSDLHFELEKQKLVGMIKENKIDEALIFAQEKLAPKAEENVCKLNIFKLSFVLIKKAGVLFV